MTLAYSCLLVAAILPILCTVIAKAGGKGFDNKNPREWLGQQSGMRARANAAQSNSFEAFPFFAVAVVAAQTAAVNAAGAHQSTIDALAVAFMVARLLYIACYLADRSTLRSICWTAGFALTIAIFMQVR